MIVTRSVVVQLRDWYSDLYWPYDEDETVLCVRYSVSGILTGNAVYSTPITFRKCQILNSYCY